MTIQSASTTIQQDSGIQMISAQFWTLDKLADFLSGQSAADPYILSPAYLSMTGRRGSKVVKFRDTSAFICAHPNLPAQNLLFYPAAITRPALLAAYFDSLPSAYATSTTIARVPKHYASGLAKELTSLSRIDVAFQAVDEETLDWRYPVHTLSTYAVSQATGHAFKDFRKNLSRAERLDLCIRKVRPEQDALSIAEIGRRWAETHAAAYNQPALELAEPYYWLGRAMKAQWLEIEGYILDSADGIPVAFVLWEKPGAGRFETSSLASINIGFEKGINEYLYWLMCNDLARQGIDQVCIGGSETEGLDIFKRKMQPQSSLELKSIIIHK